MPEQIIDVAVGLLITPDGKILLGDRPQGKPWAGWWELPGGKLEPGESVMQALARELQEELGIELGAASPWVTYVHHYPTTTVRLYFCRVTSWHGEPHGLENQQLKWVDTAAALDLPDLLPAAYPPLRWLQLPTRYLVSSARDQQGLARFIERLTTALTQGAKLVQWREPQWTGHQMQAAFEAVLKQCHDYGARLLINSAHDQQLWQVADGVQLRAQDARKLTSRPEFLSGKLLGVSAHSAPELEQARALDADFVVLGSVLPTDSHPSGATLGWEAFERLNQQAGLPVFAIGGQSPATFELAQSRGAHGIAAIRHLVD